MKEERELELGDKTSCQSERDWSTKDVEEYDEARRETQVYDREKCRVRIYDGVLYVQSSDSRPQRLPYVAIALLNQNICELYHTSKRHTEAVRCDKRKYTTTKILTTEQC